MLVDELRHLEHRDLTLPAEHRTQRIIGIDHAAILVVLQTLALDVSPQALGDLCPRQRVAAHTALSEALGRIGFMNAAFGERFVFDLVLARDFVADFFLAVPRLAVDFFFDEDDFFLAELFFFVAIASPEWDDSAYRNSINFLPRSKVNRRTVGAIGKLYREDSSFSIRMS